MEDTGKFLDLLLNITKTKRNDFANEIGVTPSAVSQWIKDGKIKTANLIQVADYFHISVREVIEGRLTDDSFLMLKDSFLIDFDELDEIEWNNDNEEEILEFLTRFHLCAELFDVLIDDYKYGNLRDDQQIQFNTMMQAIGIPYCSSIEEILKMDDEEYKFFKKMYFPAFRGISYHDCIEIDNPRIEKKFFSIAPQCILDQGLRFAIEQGGCERVITLLLSLGANISINSAHSPHILEDKEYLKYLTNYSLVKNVAFDNRDATIVSKEEYEKSIDPVATLEKKAIYCGEVSNYLKESLKRI